LLRSNHGAAGVGGVPIAGEPVAAGARDDVDGRAAGLRLAEPARQLNVDFLRGRDVGRVAVGETAERQHRAAVDGHAVHEHAPLLQVGGAVAAGNRRVVVTHVEAVEAGLQNTPMPPTQMPGSPNPCPAR
jgi:hypothetical protein